MLIPMAGTMTSFGGMKDAVRTPFNCTALSEDQFQIVSKNDFFNIFSYNSEFRWQLRSPGRNNRVSQIRKDRSHEYHLRRRQMLPRAALQLPRLRSQRHAALPRRFTRFRLHCRFICRYFSYHRKAWFSKNGTHWSCFRDYCSFADYLVDVVLFLDLYLFHFLRSRE